MRPVLERDGRTMPLDEMTRRNLELVDSLRTSGEAPESGRKRSNPGTLLGVLDRTLTAMGARLLRQWMLAPLLTKTAVEPDSTAVAALVSTPIARAALRSELDQVRDIERLASKAAAGRSTPRELRALGDSLAAPACGGRPGA